MKRIAILLGAAVLIAGPAPRPAVAAWSSDPTANLPLCIEASNQQAPASVSDGAGGAIFAWTDYRGGTGDIYAQRLSPTGVPQWTANGVPVAVAARSQDTPIIISDGSGGAIVIWLDTRDNYYEANIYAQRISSGGASLWTANGVRLAATGWPQQYPTIVSDGAGGAFVAWSDERGGTCVSCSFWEIFGQHISGDGALLWGSYGTGICTATGQQTKPTIASDGTGGAIVAWDDGRSGSGADIYAQRLSAAGAAQWTANGVPVCSYLTSQHDPAIVSDGAGGAVVSFTDYSGYGGSPIIYAQRISSDGSLQWAARGVPLSTGDRSQSAPRIVSDGESGAVVAWSDGRSGNSNIYAQRVSAAGARLWAAEGLVICNDARDQQGAAITTDGAGGAIIAWFDWRNSNYDIYAQIVSAAGTPRWTANGLPISTAAGDQQGVAMLADGESGAIIAWTDHRNGNTDIFAQRVGPSGWLGTPREPLINSIVDEPGDEGGFVRVSWRASGLDADPAGLSVYRVHRQTADGWDAGQDCPATAAASYSVLIPTDSDSVPGQAPPHVVLKVAIVPTVGDAFSSQPDSGYSVDNLAPPAPDFFVGRYDDGTATLYWKASSAADFAEYRLYRSAESGFAPGPDNLVAVQSIIDYADAVASPLYYKLCAVDVHGNASDFMLALPSVTSDVPNGMPPAFALDPVRPSPTRAGALTVHFTLPSAAAASLELLDVMGRRITAHEVGSLGTGRHAINVGEGRRLASGLYLVRLRQGANLRVARVVVLD